MWYISCRLINNYYPVDLQSGSTCSPTGNHNNSIQTKPPEKVARSRHLHPQKPKKNHTTLCVRVRDSQVSSVGLFGIIWLLYCFLCVYNWLKLYKLLFVYSKTIIFYWINFKITRIQTSGKNISERFWRSVPYCRSVNTLRNLE